MKNNEEKLISSFAASHCVLGCDSLTLKGRHHRQQTALKILKELQIQNKKHQKKIKAQRLFVGGSKTKPIEIKKTKAQY